MRPRPLFLVFTAMALFFPLSACHREEKVTVPQNPTAVAALVEKTSTAVPVAPVDSPDTASPAPEIVPPPVPVVAPEPAVKTRYRAGEDPEFARISGWPVVDAEPLPGAILPAKRIVAYYGNPLSKRMGALGEFEKDDMLRRLHDEVLRWEEADPTKPVQPALHLIAVVAQPEPGKAGKYRMVMPDEVVNRVYGWAKEAQAVMFIDIQTGHDDIRTILPRFEWLLKNPDVHLGIDPEFNLIASGVVPGKKVGTYDAADINYVTEYLAGLVKTYDLPPKVLTVHRFTRKGVSNADKIVLRPEVQIVMHMDGWGAPWLKRNTYKDYIVKEPVQFTGFKLFYHNDTKKGDPLLTPTEILRLNPQPVYIQYQ
ncbi:MAG: hypothetical protein IBX46_12180 [Desulfuromonadales bacterium]|nr:hypothetical protein [Desulfuromonadales bacterium]